MASIEGGFLADHHGVCARVFAEPLVAGAAGAVGAFSLTTAHVHVHVHEEHAAFAATLPLLPRVALDSAVETPVAFSVLVRLLVLRGVVAWTQGDESGVVAAIATPLVLMMLGRLWRWVRWRMVAHWELRGWSSVVTLLEACFVVGWSGEIREHLSTWRAYSIVSQVIVVDTDLVDRRACFVYRRAEDVQEIGQKEGYEWGWDVECRCKDDANVADSHLVELSVVDDLDQER